MLLAIDVGNSDISFGLFEGATLAHQFHTESSRTRTADEYAVLLRELFALKKVEPSSVVDAIIASVAPSVTEVMADMVIRGFGVTPSVVVAENAGMPILYEDPREVGADRVVNAVAAFERVRGGAIVVDCSTATVFDCITPRGEYLGGVLAPGIQLSAEALFARASRLHRVDLTAPPRVVGRNTMHAMQAGIVFGFASLVDEMVARIRAEVGYPCEVIATGAYARIISPHARTITTVDEALTLEGLRIVHGRRAAIP